MLREVTGSIRSPGGLLTIERWLKPGVRMKVDDERRLRDAFQVFSFIEDADGAMAGAQATENVWGGCGRRVRPVVFH